MTSPQGRSSPRRHRPHSRSHHRDRDSVNGSPAQQLVEDLGRIVLRDDHSFNKALDAQAAEQEKLHRAALDRALTEHEAVRRAANVTRQKIELDLAQDRLKHELREQQEVQEKKRQLAEQQADAERKQLDLVRRAEEALKHAADIRAAKDAAEHRIETERKAQAEAQKRDVEAKAAAKIQEKVQADAAAAAAAAAEEEAKQKAARTSISVTTPAVNPQSSQPASGTAPQAAAPSSQQPPTGGSEVYNAAVASGIVSTTEQRDIVHKRYLDLHQRLKAMREDVKKQCTQHAQLKTALGDWRRAIIKCIGQQNKVDKTANKSSTNEINTILAKASSTPGPQIDVSQYIIDYPEKVASKGSNPPSTQGSGILLFLLNHFAKCVIRQFITESAVDGLTADPLGILTAVIFSKPEYQFHGISLIDMFWAKYHRCCPPLFGIHGPQGTTAGRARLGWMREDGYSATSGHYLSEDAFFQRLTGLGAGFSALALRDFSRAKAANPAPNRLWWEALARILNTPPALVQPAHFVVLKGMLEHAIPRAIALFGGAGKAAIRQALVVFPQTKPEDPQAKALAAIASVILAKHHSTL